jgi:hypothetical protein
MTPNTALDSTTGTEPNRSIRTASLTAGIALLLLSALSIFGFIVVVKGLVTAGRPRANGQGHHRVNRLVPARHRRPVPGDPPRHRRRMGPLPGLQPREQEPVHARGHPQSCLRRGLHGGHQPTRRRASPARHDSSLAAFSPEQLHTQALLAITAYNDVWHAGLFLFGLHLLSSATWRSSPGTSRSSSQVLVAIDGLSYVVDTFGTVLSPGHWTDTATFTFIGELLLGLWLVIRGRRLTLRRIRTEGRPTAARSPPRDDGNGPPPRDHHDHAKRRTTSGDPLTARPDEARTPSVARNTLLPGSTSTSTR